MELGWRLRTEQNRTGLNTDTYLPLSMSWINSSWTLDSLFEGRSCWDSGKREELGRTKFRELRSPFWRAERLGSCPWAGLGHSMGSGIAKVPGGNPQKYLQVNTPVVISFWKRTQPKEISEHNGSVVRNKCYWVIRYLFDLLLVYTSMWHSCDVWCVMCDVWCVTCDVWQWRGGDNDVSEMTWESNLEPSLWSTMNVSQPRIS